MESAAEQRTSPTWEQISNLNATGLFKDQLAYLAADQENLTNAHQNVDIANRELDTATTSHDETVKDFKASRADAAVEIAEATSIDLVKRAIWASSFNLTEKVADPIEFGIEMESLVDQIAEKLPVGTPILRTDRTSISISRIEVIGLVTDLTTEKAASWDKSNSGKKTAKGDIATHPMHTLSINSEGPLLSNETFKHEEKPLTVKLWHDGDKDVPRIRSTFIDESSGILIGVDHIQQFIETVDNEQTKEDNEFLFKARQKNRYWAYVGAHSLDVEFPGFEQTDRFQEWHDQTMQAYTNTFRRLATGEKTYRTDHNRARELSSTTEEHGLEVWPKEYLLTTLKAFNITPDQVKDNVRTKLNQEVNTALEARQKVQALADLDQIFELLDS